MRSRGINKYIERCNKVKGGCHGATVGLHYQRLVCLARLVLLIYHKFGLRFIKRKFEGVGWLNIGTRYASVPDPAPLPAALPARACALACWRHTPVIPECLPPLTIHPQRKLSRHFRRKFVRTQKQAGCPSQARLQAMTD